jgi:predicted metal-dependent hydrolase
LNRRAPWHPEDWQTLDDWLYGVDLFNWFYFWEAHEAWEGLWTAAARGAAPSLMLQGLIQIAAASLKTHLHVLAGARTLSAQGLEKLRRAATISPRLLGLDLREVDGLFSEYFRPLERNDLPVIGPEVPVLVLEVVKLLGC